MLYYISIQGLYKILQVWAEHLLLVGKIRIWVGTANGFLTQNQELLRYHKLKRHGWREVNLKRLA